MSTTNKSGLWHRYSIAERQLNEKRARQHVKKVLEGEGPGGMYKLARTGKRSLARAYGYSGVTIRNNISLDTILLVVESRTNYCFA